MIASPSIVNNSQIFADGGDGLNGDVQPGGAGAGGGGGGGGGLVVLNGTYSGPGVVRASGGVRGLAVQGSNPGAIDGVAGGDGLIVNVA